MFMSEQPQVEIKDKFCLTIEEAVAYFNIGEKKLRKIVSDNMDTGVIIQNGVKILIKRKLFEDYLKDITAISLSICLHNCSRLHLFYP